MTDKLTIEYQVTATYRITLTPDELRNTFGLGGTAAEYLVSRLLALNAYDSTILAAVHGQGEYVADDRYDLRALNGYRLGTDGVQYVELSDDPPTCILTGAPGENPDDCATHDHEKE